MNSQVLISNLPGIVTVCLPAHTLRPKQCAPCLQVQPCTTIVCSFTATYPQPPPAGQYTATSTVQYQQLNSARIDVAEVQTAFKVRLCRQTKHVLQAPCVLQALQAVIQLL